MTPTERSVPWPSPRSMIPSTSQGRTYQQFARLLDMLEEPDRDDEITFPQLVSALKLLLAYDLSAIRKFARDDADDEPGSAAHKFAKVFSQNAERSRARSERAKAALTLVTDDDDDPAA
jgi:hypothetical protein